MGLYPYKENPDDYQGLVDDFGGAAAAVADITSAEEVMNNVFLGP
jgi:peroxiredoxin family protein